jgi:SARP family transcriptional regulator, regulator of embCAB operon
LHPGIEFALLVSFLLGHLQQVLGGDHGRNRGMIGLHVLAPALDDLLVVLATDDEAALTYDSLCHAGMVADVVVQLCGRLVVRSGGVELAGQLPGAQGRIAFAWLVYNRHRAAPRDELATAIWGDERPAASGQALRALLSKLRSVVGRDSLRADGPLSLTLDDNANVDVEVAARAIHDAESGIARREWERAWIASQIAMNVPRRSFLTGHDGAWVDERRREVGAVYQRALATLAAAALQLGETELLTAERAARELVAAEPLSEGATSLLMRALIARCERPAALVAYDEFRTRLRDELGVAPGPRLLALHSEIVIR